MSSEIVELINLITRRRRLDREFVTKTLRDAILTTVKKKKGLDYPIEVEIDARKGDLHIYIQKEIVSEVTDPDRQISIEEARKIDPEGAIEGRKILLEVPLSSFGRSMVYRIQNIFMQRIREEERQHIYKDFQERVGELITGMIQKVDKTGVYVGLGRAEALLPPEEQIKGEKYKQGGNIRALILKVTEPRRGRPQIILSRTHPDFLRKLLEHEIPEVAEGTVEIRAVERIPGKRAKVAVRSKDARIDPVGACIGLKGTRIQPITKELFGEKIDVVRWDPDILHFAVNAMSPADVLTVYEADGKIYVVVPDEHVPEAKGKEAQNVILASRLVGKEIIVQPLSEYKGAPSAVTTLDLDISQETREKLRRAGLYEFREVPTLSELISADLSEEEAMKILSEIEEKLEAKKKEVA